MRAWENETYYRWGTKFQCDTFTSNTFNTISSLQNSKRCAPPTESKTWQTRIDLRLAFLHERAAEKMTEIAKYAQMLSGNPNMDAYYTGRLGPMYAALKLIRREIHQGLFLENVVTFLGLRQLRKTWLNHLPKEIISHIARLAWFRHT